MKRHSTFILIGLVLWMILIIQGNAQTQWTKYSGNPVLDLGSSGSWDDAWVSFPIVIHDDTQFIMYYTGFPIVSTTGAQVGRATSADGINWTREGTNPLLTTGSTGEWDDASVMTGPVIFDGSVYKMWFSGFDGSNYRNGMATSSDGIAWTKYQGNPVFDLGASGQWDDSDVAAGSVIFDGSTYKMWYVGRESATGIWRVGYATSPDGINWQRYAQNPVLDIGESGEWDDEDIYNCYVLYHDNIYEMWYWGDGGSIGKTGYATSPDGVTWTKFAQNPVLIPEDSWENLVTAIGSVSLIDTSYRMWYMGQSSSSGRIGLATNWIIDNIAAPQSKLPLKFELSNNYPNPFNPKTMINYQLPNTSYVQLIIYNLLGQEMATLVSEKQKAGHHQVEWNALGFASGVYLYRIITDNGFTDTKKLMLLK